MEDSLKKRYIIKLLANMISGIIGIIFIAIVPKALGPVAYGQFVYLQGFFMKVVSFLDMGTSTAFFTKLSAKNTRKELISFYFFYSIVLLLLLFILVFISEIFYFDKILLPDIDSKYVYFGLIFAYLSWLAQVFIKISDAYAMTVSVEIIKIFYKISSLFLLIYFVSYTAFDLSGYFYFNYISLGLFLIILSRLFIQKGIFGKKIFTFDFSFSKITKEFISYCSPLVVYTIISILCGLFDIWLLQQTGGSIQTAYYGLAYSIAAICFLFTSAMTPIITREFSKFYESKDIEEIKMLYARYIPMLYSIAAFLSVFIAFQSEVLLDVFADEKYKDAYLVLIIIAFYPIHQTYGQLSGSLFYAMGKTKLILNIALFTQPLGLALSFLFIYVLGLDAVGLAVKMVLGQFIAVNIQLYFNVKFLKLKMADFILHQIFAVTYFIFIAVIATSMFEESSKLESLLVSVVIYTSLAIVSAYLFPKIFAVSREEIRINLLKIKDILVGFYRKLFNKNEYKDEY